MRQGIVISLIILAVISLIGAGVSVRKTPQTPTATFPPAPSPAPVIHPRATFTYRPLPIMLTQLKRPPGSEGEDLSARRNDEKGSRKNKNGSQQPDMSLLFADDFESGRLRKCWQRTQDAKSRCQVTTDKETGNHILRLRTAPPPHLQHVSVAVGSSLWTDYTVSFRFRLIKGENAWFEFRSMRPEEPAGNATPPDAIRVKMEEGILCAASRADGVLERGISIPLLTPCQAGPTDPPCPWFRVEAVLHANRFEMRLLGENRNSSGTDDTNLLAEISKTTKVRRGGIVIGVYRGEMWVDDVLVTPGTRT